MVLKAAQNTCSVKTEWVHDIKAVICRNERLCAEECLYKHYLKDLLPYNATRAPAAAGTMYYDAAMQTIPAIVPRTN